MNPATVLTFILALFGGFAAGAAYMNDLWSFDCNYVGHHGNNRNGIVYRCHPTDLNQAPARQPQPPKRTRA